MTADTLFERAVERRRANDLTAALALLRKAESCAQEAGRFDLLAQILGESGWILSRTGDMDGAIDAYTRAVDAASTAEDPIGHAMWLVSLVGALPRRADAARPRHRRGRAGGPAWLCALKGGGDAGSDGPRRCRSCAATGAPAWGG
jgi:tetratricopeptide (TPR) repeat protein